MLLFLFACAKLVETPFEGPGYDPESGPLVVQDSYVLGLTELHVKNAPGPGGKFGDHAQAVGEYLYTPDNNVEGFVGGSFRNIGQLKWWTLTVWTSEEAMLDFVLSEPHLSAMADLEAVSSAARSTNVVITAADVPVSWEFALATLEDVTWIIE